MSETILQSLSETHEYAKAFLGTLKQEKEHATIVGLSGDLGSGKTTFVRSVANILGVTQEVVSPTFVIAKFYPIRAGQKWDQLVHIDAYRIENTEEIRPLRLEETFADPKNLVIVEWPEQLGTFFPADATLLALRFIDETTRGIAQQQ